MSKTLNKPSTLRADLQAVSEFIERGAKVLDLGCGDGELLAFLVHEKQVQGRGIELSEAGVLACVRKGLSVRQGNINEGLADYPDQAFDYVILSQTLPFLNEPEQVLEERLRVGRQAILSFPNWGYWRCRLEMLFSGRVPQAPDFEQKWHDARRWRMFTVADFADFCRLANIYIEDEVYLSGDWRIEGKRANWQARTAVYTLTNGR
ncbi:MAG: methionine biosynthesis protein MetW [Anaerolineales bacterium]|nr:methionine biosynthesis protein MetW [Anaerolineales bacterium]